MKKNGRQNFGEESKEPMCKISTRKPNGLGDLHEWDWLKGGGARQPKPQRSSKHGQPNFFLRIREDGQVYTSIRLTVVAACRMYLNHFPMDVQVCNLKAESFGYDTNDVIFEWLPKKPLDLASDLQDRLESFFLSIFYEWTEK